jgi:small conductance mechanosensitive channel
VKFSTPAHPGMGAEVAALLKLPLILAWLGLCVMLPGTALAQTAEQRAEEEAPETPVAASIQVSRVTPDEGIAARLQGILEATGWFDRVSVSVDSGVVFLRGRVREEAQREWAGNLARNTEGVVAVVNNLALVEVSPWDLSPTLDKLRQLAASAFRVLPLALLSLALLWLSWWVARAVFRGMQSLLGRRLTSNLLRDVLSRAVSVVAFVLGAYAVLQVAGLTGLAVTLVGGTGLLGLAIGFAFRDIAENFLASILISIQRPFAMGDFIEINGHRGFVQRVNTRATLIMTRDGNHVQIPNAIIYKNEIINYTANPRTRQEFLVGIGYDDSIPEAQSVVLAVLRDHPAVLQEPEPLVLVEELSASTVNLRVSFWIDIETFDPLKVRSAVIRKTKSALDQAGISMPDEAREVVFPGGVPIEVHDASTPEDSAPATPAPLGTDAVDVHRAEGGLRNEDEQIERQARAARLPEGGDNLL